MLNIKVLGSGCPNCKKVEAHVREALDHLAPVQEAEIEKITDIIGISQYVLKTPGLAINDQVVSEGRIPSVSEIESWLAQALTAEA